MNVDYVWPLPEATSTTVMTVHVKFVTTASNLQLMISIAAQTRSCKCMFQLQLSLLRVTDAASPST